MTRKLRADELPGWPLGMSRVEAAAYIGVSSTKFDEMVDDGRMPKPKKIDGRIVWDREAVYNAFKSLPNEEESNPWDETEAA